MGSYLFPNDPNDLCNRNTSGVKIWYQIVGDIPCKLHGGAQIVHFNLVMNEPGIFIKEQSFFHLKYE